jgi:hypothetical protein
MTMTQWSRNQECRIGRLHELLGAHSSTNKKILDLGLFSGPSWQGERLTMMNGTMQ